MEFTMRVGKETKGTYMFEEVEEGSGIPSLYIQKKLFDKTPTEITVTLSGSDALKEAEPTKTVAKVKA